MRLSTSYSPANCPTVFSSPPHLFDDFCLEACRILLPFLFLHVTPYKPINFCLKYQGHYRCDSLTSQLYFIRSKRPSPGEPGQHASEQVIEHIQYRVLFPLRYYSSPCVVEDVSKIH